MKAFEFPATVGPDGHLAIPDVPIKLPPNQTVRVILLVPDSSAYDTDLSPDEEDAAWARFAAEQLSRQYGEADEVYDQI